MVESKTSNEGGITTVHHLRDPLKKYRDRIEPGSLLEEQAKTNPTEAYRSIVWYEFTDQHIKSISRNKNKIDYKKMEDILETKLKGNETWDDLAAIRDRKFPMPEDMASGGIAGELHLNDGGRVSFTKGGKVSSGLAKILGV